MELAHRMIAKSGLPVSFQEINAEELGFHGGAYVADTKTVFLNPFHEIKEYTIFLKENNIVDMSPTELTSLLLAHELNHADDPYLAHRNERERHFYQLSLQSCTGYDEKAIKYYYKQCYQYRMQTEIKAWENVSRFLLSPIEERKIQAFRNYALGSYKEKSRYEFEAMMITAKLFPKLDKVSLLFPADVSLHIELYDEKKQGYNKETNTFSVFLEPYLLPRQKRNRQIHIIDHILYDSLYQYVKTSCNYYTLDAYKHSVSRLTHRFSTIIDVTRFMETENQNFLWNEKQIFDSLRHFFGQQKTFTAFENQKMKDTKKQLEEIKTYTKNLFQRENTTVK